ncbi:hypothetical protein M409DRAFT_17216 [Zasmidium cellare ATCC 36951]|uniref:Uncharacterized protein n=1 Tax=Zasmidium cellare ATCC 36951 TaxID=1080233 RepID=A0A6A6D2F6_ZASCE|nr:uncharacterized protein M409DRAFT_17216 [Zasmidium cellare ATCC 36951]KAF2173273.1 hypothetical protein M409DRAFT_17216 [Zasmidium cellare ATCC 36951]
MPDRTITIGGLMRQSRESMESLIERDINFFSYSDPKARLAAIKEIFAPGIIWSDFDGSTHYGQDGVLDRSCVLLGVAITLGLFLLRRRSSSRRTPAQATVEHDTMNTHHSTPAEAASPDTTSSPDKKLEALPFEASSQREVVELPGREIGIPVDVERRDQS